MLVDNNKSMLTKKRAEYIHYTLSDKPYSQGNEYTVSPIWGGKSFLAILRAGCVHVCIIRSRSLRASSKVVGQVQGSPA